MPELAFFRRGEEVFRFTLDKDRVVLGRGERCDVIVPDPDVSRQQAELRFDGSRCTLVDLSGKGTVVGDRRVAECPLELGMDLGLGQWRALYRDTSALDGDASTAAGAGTEAVEAPSAPQPREQLQLRVRAGSDEQLFRLRGDTFLLGSDPSCDVALPRRYVSGRHLKLTRRGDRFHLVDQASTNGTWLGSLRVFDAEVPLFTTLRIGDLELTLEPAGLSDARGRHAAFEGIIGADASMRQLAELVERVAPSTAAVTVLGESGTGKELVAHALHRRSTRAQRPFIPVNCAAISKELVESELFGHEKGAFTGAMASRKGAFEEADGGTLFLDEVGELPIDLQAKLLRALESGELKRVGASRPVTVDVRVVAATNRDLLQLAREGRFREDLFYRLSVVPLHLPPLRSRLGDLPALVEHFVERFAPRGQEVLVSGAAQARLKAHAWPGNVRELRNVVHRALLLRKANHIDADDITFDVPADSKSPPTGADFVPGDTLEAHVLRFERRVVEQALAYFGDNRERAARELGVARSTFFKRLRAWGINA